MYPNRRLSYSSIKEFAKSPRHYLAYLNKQYLPTDSMMLGNVFEALLCNTFDEKFAIFEKPEPDKTMATKANKEAYKEFKENNTGKDIIKSEMMEIAEQMHANCQIFLQESGVLEIEEMQKFVSGSIHDLEFHGYIDFIHDGCIYDIKTTNSELNYKALNNTILKMGYHLQAAVYCELTGLNNYRLLFQSNKAPYCTQIVELSQDYIEYGKMQLNKYCELFKSWLDCGKPDNGQEFTQGHILQLDLPAWI